MPGTRALLVHVGAPIGGGRRGAGLVGTPADRAGAGAGGPAGTPADRAGKVAGLEDPAMAEPTEAGAGEPWTVGLVGGVASRERPCSEWAEGVQATGSV